MQNKSVSWARSLIFLLVFALFTGATISLYANLHEANSQYKELASVVGRTFFQAILVMRDWNTRHQGVYIPVSSDVQPNEYLADTRRDLTSLEGIRLTKINHAQMTRMISELLDQQRGIHIHLTSLTPIRPLNAPDTWERGALTEFTKGRQEVYEVVGNEAGAEIFRYMAPLKAEGSCMNCHHEHKSVQDIRGGVSVSFSFAPFKQLMDKSNRQIWSLHLVGFSASLVPIFFLGRKLVQDCEALHASLLRVRQLEGLVPICANCKKIRTEGGDADIQMSWVPMEPYIEAHTNAEFTHGLCPDCREKLYPGLRAARSPL